ncbi:MAG: hypothetical protein V7L11_02140 [Nostoc sp.]|uniref:hypothetical protein n=1 Tax=Nostoc sp. TaxID=1180 RepID=UPI002FF7F6D7
MKANYLRSPLSLTINQKRSPLSLTVNQKRSPLSLSILKNLANVCDRLPSNPE